MLFKIILFVCFIPIPFIIYFVLRNEAKPKKNIILGVTLPLEARQDAAVAAVVKVYITLQTAALAVIVLLASPLLFIRYQSIVLTWYFIWLILALVLPTVLFMRSNKKLRALKQQNGWFGESTGVELVDIKLALTPKKTLSFWWFVPPVLISLMPLVHAVLTLQGRDEFWPMLVVYGSFAVMTVVY